MSPPRLARRTFLKTAAAVGAPWIVPATVFGATAPNNRITVGCIGTGNQGFNILKQFLKHAEAQVVAVCDVNRGSFGYRDEKQYCGREPAQKLVHEHYAAARASGRYRGCDAVGDFRDVLARRDIDAVTIVTPDHWHAVMTVLAARAGKDIYCEKPLSLTVRDGQEMVRAVREHRRILQTGSHERSNPVTRHACELVRNGRIGKLQRVTVVLPFWNTKGGPFAPQPVPPNLNWDLWQGQAPAREYCPERVHFNFRWWSDYAGGIITDWGQHHMDIAFWGMGVEDSGPLSVEGTAIFPNEGAKEPTRCYDNPDRFLVKMQFPNQVELLYFVAHDQKYRESITPEDEARLFSQTQADLPEKSRNGIMFIGDQGRVFVNRGRAYGKPVDELKENPLTSNAIRLYESNDHMANFFECVKTRKTPAATVDVAHRVITACHLGNIAIRLKRKIVWDPVKEEIVGDAEAANSIYVRRPQRAPYQITA
ncbi:MAG: Gfo/Idh/MocA family oxidoreductase [Thermoguttaceae bacterium]|nr:Gfo/Idh/MocA family oxidoreductase [Thermoguttaceae bacterium]